MVCREWGTELTDWALDELSPAKARELEQHLEHCQECAQAAQRLLGVRQALKSSLIDRDMPAHVVVFGDKAQSRFAGFWAALPRTAALSAAGAVIFLAIVSVGLRFGGAAAASRCRLAPAGANPGRTEGVRGEGGRGTSIFAEQRNAGCHPGRIGEPTPGTDREPEALCAANGVFRAIPEH